MFRIKVEHYVLVQTLIACCLNLGEVTNGYGVAWSAPVLPKLDDVMQSPVPYEVTETQKYFVACIMYIGCVGAYFGGYLSNQIGRKRSLIFGGVIHLGSYVLLTAAKNLAMIYVGRVLVGISMSFLSVVGLVYLGEIASPNIRGIMLTCMGVFHAFGGLVVYSVAPFVSYAAVGYVNITLIAIYIVICCFLPESPIYYVLKDDEDSARSVLQYLGQSDDINSELKTMIHNIQEQDDKKYLWKELVFTKSNRKSLFITMFLSFFQQSSGIIAVIFYANTIFRYAGSSVQPDAAIIVGAMFVVGTIVAPMFIETYGRRILLMVSTAGLTVSMAILGGYFYMRSRSLLSVEGLGWLPLTFLVLAQFAYSMGLTIIPNTLSGELFTPKVRGLGSSISLCTAWVSGFVSTTIFSYVAVALGIHFTFWIFAISNALALIFVTAFVPETMGKSLMEIQQMLDK